MARETNFQALTDIKVFVGTEITFGTATLTNGTWNEYQVLDYSFSFPSPALEVSGTRAGRATQADNQVIHRPENELYTASLTLRGTSTAILAMCGAYFGDGADPAALTGDYAPPHGAWKDGTASTTQQTLLFQKAGSDATNDDILMTSCIPTRMKIMQDIGNNNGMMICEVDYVSGYKPSETALTATSPTVDTAKPTYIQDLVTSSINTQELMPWSWEIELNRTIQRVSYKDITDVKPYGMVQVGDVEVTGALSVKADDSVNDLAATFYSDVAVQLSLEQVANLTITCPKIFIDKSNIEKGDGIQMMTIPFRATHDATSESSNILSISFA